MIYIYAVSDSNKHFSKAIDEYTKRLGKSITIKYLKPSKKDTEKEIIKQESELLLSELSKVNAYKILLYIDSKTLSTIIFYDLLEQKKQIHGNIVFVIGGAYGVDGRVIEGCDTKLSFSPMTLPHGMALMILLEQIYRVDSIKKGKKYHHQ